MIQKLSFESAWDKAIAPADREKIVSHFQEQARHLEVSIYFSFLWKAKNHKDERLVTVLIHNHTENTLHLENTVIAYYEQDKHIATGVFNLPCSIEAKTSMPWTFIFSESNQINTFPQYLIIHDELTQSLK